MAKVPIRHLRQLEIPLLTNLNSIDKLAKKKMVTSNNVISTENCTDDEKSLKATEEDLTIYRSIGDGFLSRFK